MQCHEILNQELANRQNSLRYSVSKFAKELNLSPSFLNRVLKGERLLGEDSAFEIAQKLWESEDKRQDFCLQARKERTKSEIVKQSITQETSAPETAPFDIVEENIFKFFAEWEHIAILQLFSLKDFKLDPSWIAKKLKIDRLKSEISLERLQNLKILALENGLLKPSSKKFTTKDVPSAAVLKVQKALLQKSIDSLNNDPRSTRVVMSAMSAVDSSKIPQANAMIASFISELSSFLATSENDQIDAVYNLNVNLIRIDQP